MNSEEVVRNFVIIAHIDHGKTSLADGLIARSNAKSRKKLSLHFEGLILNILGET